MNDAITAGTSYDLGLYTTASTPVVVDVDAYGSAIDMSSARTTASFNAAYEARNITSVNNKVHQDGGVTTDLVGAIANVGAWIYTRSAGIWTQQGSKLPGTIAVGDWAPRGCSISADGNTAIVGGQDDSIGVGAAWVYLRSAGLWTQQGNKLVGTGAAGNAGQGCSVSLSSDGNTAIIGGPI